MPMVDRWKSFLASILILISLASIPQPAAGADYTIHLQADQFKVTWRINAWQNLTGFQGYPNGTQILPPNLNTTLSTGDLSTFTMALQKALQAKVNTVTITQPTIHIISNTPHLSCPATLSCPLQWLNVTVDFQVRQNPSVTGGVAKYDLSWRSIRLEDDLEAGSVPFNRLGDRYLLQGLLPFIDFPSSIGRGMSVTISGIRAPLNNVTYQAPTHNIVLFDSTGFQPQLEGWTVTSDLRAGTQTWSSPSNSGFGVDATLSISEASTVTRLSYFAAVLVSAEVTAPLNAFVKGDTLYVDTSGGFWEKVGLVTILGSLGIWAGTMIVEWRIARTPRARRRKDKR